MPATLEQALLVRVDVPAQLSRHSTAKAEIIRHHAGKWNPIVFGVVLEHDKEYDGFELPVAQARRFVPEGEIPEGYEIENRRYRVPATQAVLDALKAECKRRYRCDLKFRVMRAEPSDDEFEALRAERDAALAARDAALKKAAEAAKRVQSSRHNSAAVDPLPRAGSKGRAAIAAYDSCDGDFSVAAAAEEIGASSVTVIRALNEYRPGWND